MYAHATQVNRDYTGGIPRWAYLMRRGAEEMYDGYFKYDLQGDCVSGKAVCFGPGRLGGEVRTVL